MNVNMGIRADEGLGTHLFDFLLCHSRNVALIFMVPESSQSCPWAHTEEEGRGKETPFL